MSRRIASGDTSPPPMDTTRGITNALSAFGGGGEEVGAFGPPVSSLTQLCFTPFFVRP